VKIRTRLMLSLLPTLIGSIALVVTLMAFRWHEEILDGFKHQLRTAAASTAIASFRGDIDLQQTAHELGLATLSFIPIGQPLPTDDFTGTAPVFDAEDHLTGHMAASGHAEAMEKKFREGLSLVLVSGTLAIGLLIASLYFIAGRIALPMQKLNNAALAIAAGQYGESAPTRGPKEVADLANTLNTMSECLLENIHRLKENALFRERMYGEYECAMLLQHLMLQKNIDECRSDAVAVKSLTIFSDDPRGLLLNFPPKPDKANLFSIHMAEAEDTGFEGMYELLTQYKYSKEIAKHTSLIFDRTSSTLQSRGPHLPLFWSLDGKKFIEPKTSEVLLECGDFFFLFNEGLNRFFKEERRSIQDILAKVLKVFAQDGLETTFSMLQKEITFAAKRKKFSEDIHLLCFQVLNP
jgi:HAMP domain-containing protein